MAIPAVTGQHGCTRRDQLEPGTGGDSAIGVRFACLERSHRDAIQRPYAIRSGSVEAESSFCSCGRAAGGRCAECANPVCYWPFSWDHENSCGRMYGGRLLCPADREAAEASSQTAARASEESAHAAWVERVKSAVPAVIGTLNHEGSEPRPLATVVNKGSWELEERVGLGWILFTATHDQIEGDMTHATVVLAEDGRLFWALSEDEIELGRKRWLGGPRETVVAVTGEVGLNEKRREHQAKENGLTLQDFTAAMQDDDRAKERALAELEARMTKYLA